MILSRVALSSPESLTPNAAMIVPDPGPLPVQPEFDFARLPAATRPLVAAPPAPECELCVTIPVYNEETDIAHTLAALAAQTDLDGQALDPALYEVLVLANNCTDGTGEVVRGFAARHPAFRLHLIEILLAKPHAHVGAARRLVMDEACRRLESLRKPRGVIAATDGDTRVRPNWVAANLAEMANGADAVGGRILAGPEQVAALAPGTRLYYRLDTAYRTLRAAYETILNPDPANGWPRHHHFFGASLAVTAETYRRAGGLPVVPCLEDMAFADALERLGARMRQSPAVNVLTSLRVAGRVDVGLSGTLSKWTRAAEDGEPLLLESPDTIARESLNRVHLRRRWVEGYSPKAARKTAAALELDPGWLAERWQRARSAGELCQAVFWHHRERQTGPYALPLMEVRTAIAELRRRITRHRADLRERTVRPPARTSRAGIFPPAGPADAAEVVPRPPPGTFRGPDRPSADSRARTASSEPAAGVLPVPVG